MHDEYTIKPGVALLAEGVDRNHTVCRCRCLRGVALLAEGVDRNAFQRQNLKTDFRVALLAEGVDRNAGLGVVLDAVRCVALLAEGVDINSKNPKDIFL